MIEVSTCEDVICAKGTVSVKGFTSDIYLFLVDGILIDTGPQSLEKEIIPFYQEHAFDSVILTHSHEDHVGTAAWIEQNRETPIYIHRDGIEVCSKPFDYPFYRQFVWGRREAFSAQPLKDSFHSRNLDWKVIETQGHAHDHVVLFNKETGRLFSGDLFIAPKPKIMRKDESVPIMINSLRTILAHDFQSMFCGHAGFLPDGKRMLRMKLDYLEILRDEVMDLNKQGWTIAEISQKMFPLPMPIQFQSNGEFHVEHMIRSIVDEVIS